MGGPFNSLGKIQMKLRIELTIDDHGRVTDTNAYVDEKEFLKGGPKAPMINTRRADALSVVQAVELERTLHDVVDGLIARLRSTLR